MKINQSHYDASYFESDKYGGKEYHNPDGKVSKWGYTARQYWDGWNAIMPIIKRMFKPKQTLDVGCGAGTYVAKARQWGMACRGIDYSEWAIKHPLPGAGGFIALGDVRDIPFKDKQFDFVISGDLLEHISVRRGDLDKAISELYRVSSKWLFLNIGGIPNEAYNFKPYYLKEDEEVPMGLETTAVAGHLTVNYPDFWAMRLISGKINKGWRFRPDLVAKIGRAHV